MVIKIPKTAVKTLRKPIANRNPTTYYNINIILFISYIIQYITVYFINKKILKDKK